MILRLSVNRVARRAQRAFTLMEVMVAVAIIGFTFISLYSGIAFCTSTVPSIIRCGFLQLSQLLHWPS